MRVRLGPSRRGNRGSWIEGWSKPSRVSPEISDSVQPSFQPGIGFRRWHPGAADGAGMAAQLGNRGVVDGDAHIINSGTPGARDFPRGCDQEVAELARPDEGDVALCSNRAFVMGVAGKRERRIRQQEDETAMGDALAVDHVRLDLHRQRSFARLDLENLHAETLAGVVILPHRVGAGAREIVGRKCGLDVHRGLPARFRGRLTIRTGSKTFSPKTFSPCRSRACWNKPLELSD